MAKRYFTLGVLILALSMAAWAQGVTDPSQCGKEGSANPCGGDVVYGTSNGLGSIITGVGLTNDGTLIFYEGGGSVEASNTPSAGSQDVMEGPSVFGAGGAGGSWGGGAGAMAAGAQYRNFLGQQGMHSFLSATKTAVGVWAVGQTGAAFGVLAAVGLADALFSPPLPPGVMKRGVVPTGDMSEWPNLSRVFGDDLENMVGNLLRRKTGFGVWDIAPKSAFKDPTLRRLYENAAATQSRMGQYSGWLTQARMSGTGGPYSLNTNQIWRLYMQQENAMRQIGQDLLTYPDLPTQ